MALTERELVSLRSMRARLETLMQRLDRMDVQSIDTGACLGAAAESIEEAIASIDDAFESNRIDDALEKTKGVH